MHSIMDPPVGTFAGSIVEPTGVPTEDILPPTEDILPPLLPASEDILTASDNIPVRLSVSGRNGRNEFGSKQISAAPCRLDPLVVLALAAVLRRRAVAVGKLTALDDHDERNRLRLGVHRTGDHRFHANAES